LGDEANNLRTIGASTARSEEVSRLVIGDRWGSWLTLALHAVPVNTGTANHDIVDNGEAALAADPVALTVLQTTVGQDGGFVKADSSAVLRFCQRQFFGMEEVPYRPVDNLIGCVAENVNN
jgi:hypothetical protein